MKQILRDIEFGVHTFELSQTVTKNSLMSFTNAAVPEED